MRRVLLGGVMSWALAGAPVQAAQFDLATAGIDETQAAMASGALTSEKLVSLYLARIEAYDAKGPRIGAMITTSGNALEQARALDAERRGKGPRGPLHGIPVVLKDNIDTFDMPTTGGSFVLAGAQPAADAPIVRRLREAGAIILGKVNLDDFAAGGSGFSSVSGQTRSPYNPLYTPLGSSGGSGAAVAAWFAPLSLGTDTGGSLRSPTSVSAIYGLKPTRGLLSRTGHIVPPGGVLDSWQQIGPIARSVEDLALIAPLICGPDNLDASCAPVPWNAAPVDLASLRAVYYPHNGYSAVDEDTQRAVTQAAAWLKEAVASMAQEAPTKLIETVHRTRGTLSMGDGWAWYQRLADRWGTKHLSASMAESVKDGKAISSTAMVAAWEEADEAKSKLLTWFSRYDVLLCPVAGEPATLIDWDPDAPGEFRGALSDVGVFNSTGWPVAVVRVGSSADGRLPIGIQVVAQPWREDVALAVARYLEQRSGGWKPTTIL